MVPSLPEAGVSGNHLCGPPLLTLDAGDNRKDSMTFAALVVAAGRGLRAGGDGPKQYQVLGGRPVLERTLRAVLEHDDCALVQTVIHPDDQPLYAEATAAINDQRLMAPAHGGPTRQASVRAGLAALQPHMPEVVLVHDAARPFLAAPVIDRVLAAVRPGTAAFPALPIVDTLWRAEGRVVRSPHARDNLWRAQTPQGFKFDDIVEAHAQADPEATDDIAVACAAGLEARVVLGDGDNFKITLAEDFHRAERLLR